MDKLFEYKEVTYSCKANHSANQEKSVESSDDDVFDFFFGDTNSTKSSSENCSKEAYVEALKNRTDHSCVVTQLYQIIYDNNKIKFKHSIHTREHSNFPIKKVTHISEDGTIKLYEYTDKTIYGNKRNSSVKTITLDLTHNNVYSCNYTFKNRKSIVINRTNQLNSLTNIFKFGLTDIRLIWEKESQKFNFFNLYKKAFGVDEINEVEIRHFNKYLAQLFKKDIFSSFTLSEFISVWYLMRNNITYGELPLTGEFLINNGLLYKNFLKNETAIDKKISEIYNIDIKTVNRIALNSTDLFEDLTIYSLFKDIEVLEIMRSNPKYRSKLFRKYNPESGYFNYVDNGWPDRIKIDFSKYFMNYNKKDAVDLIMYTIKDSFSISSFFKNVEKFENYFGVTLSGTITVNDLNIISTYFIHLFEYAQMKTLYLDFGCIDKTMVNFKYLQNTYEIKPIIRAYDYENILPHSQYHTLITSIVKDRVTLGIFENRRLTHLITTKFFNNKFSKKITITKFIDKKIFVYEYGMKNKYQFKPSFTKKVDSILKYYEKNYKNINYNINLKTPYLMECKQINKLLN